MRNEAVYSDANRNLPGHCGGPKDSEAAMTDPAGTSGNRARRRDASGRLPDQLPSGRHGLLPSAVAANQRERILAAVLSAAAERGYAEMSVEAITAGAGVSRRTFYEHFKNKEDAFMAAYDAVVHQAATQVRRAYLNQSTALERLRAGIKAFLEFLAADPQAARTGIVEVLAAGPRAIARRNAAVALFAEMDRVSARLPPLRAPVPGTSMACPQVPSSRRRRALGRGPARRCRSRWRRSYPVRRRTPGSPRRCGRH